MTDGNIIWWSKSAQAILKLLLVYLTFLTTQCKYQKKLVIVDHEEYINIILVSVLLITVKVSWWWFLGHPNEIECARYFAGVFLKAGVVSSKLTEPQEEFTEEDDDDEDEKKSDVIMLSVLDNSENIFIDLLFIKEVCHSYLDTFKNVSSSELYCFSDHKLGFIVLISIWIYSLIMVILWNWSFQLCAILLLFLIYYFTYTTILS